MNNEGMNNIDGRKRGFYLQGLPQIAQEEFCEHILDNNFCEKYGNVLVHSAPQEKYDMYDYRYHSIREYCVWKREPLEPRLFPDKTVVFGHTMTKGLQFSYSKRMRIAFSDGMIGIDCGCAYPGFGGQLGCLRLEDMTEFYSDEGIVTAEEAWKWRKENVTPFENDRKGDSYERIESGDQKTR